MLLNEETDSADFPKFVILEWKLQKNIRSGTLAQTLKWHLEHLALFLVGAGFIELDASLGLSTIQHISEYGRVRHSRNAVKSLLWNPCVDARKRRPRVASASAPAIRTANLRVSLGATQPSMTRPVSCEGRSCMNWLCLLHLISR